jgi:hypothetical protein
VVLEWIDAPLAAGLSPPEAVVVLLLVQPRLAVFVAGGGVGWGGEGATVASLLLALAARPADAARISPARGEHRSRPSWG